VKHNRLAGIEPHPQPTLWTRPSPFSVLVAYWGFVDLKIALMAKLLAHDPINSIQMINALFDPLNHLLAGEPNPVLTSIQVLLSVIRKMITEPADQQIGHERGGRFSAQ
jgi:hypothetical protein